MEKNNNLNKYEELQFNNHLLSSGDLLDEKGNLQEAGFAYNLVKKYDRSKIKARKGRIKEWDYYYFGNDKFGFALTIDDNSYMTMISFSYLDFVNKKEITKSKIKMLTRKHVDFPSTSEIGDVELNYNDKAYLTFKNDGKKRHLFGAFTSFDDDKEIMVDCFLEPTIDGSMVIATPFNKEKHFYYNQKINCLKASGSVVIGEKEFDLSDCYGVLDWGRGVWTYKNTWYWGSLSACQDGKTIGFNLGYGFGDTSKASENMLFFDGKCIKLDDCEFIIPKDEKGKDKFLDEWKITSKSERAKIALTFSPILNRHAKTDVLIIASIQNQVFGKINGTIEVDSNVYEFKNLTGFCEKVLNKW
ncbi:MAG: DUF2804 domain-containing protein [Bacilli bacterium]|nr:DUF2804 domain-containing protein [Bacilli bacterium]